jgi:hypothetical protein
MAPTKSNTNKRKRTSTSATPDALSKRPRKYTKSRPKSNNGTTNPSKQEDEEYFAAKNILDERARTYLIEWEGTDPETGESYEPTWEPKSNATPALITEWKARKAANRAAVKETPKKSATSRTSRKSRVVQSSEPSTPARASTVPTETSTNVSPLSELRPPAHPVSHVQIDPRGSSFDRDEFVRFSQIAAASSAQSPSPSQLQSNPNLQIQYGGDSPLFYTPPGSEQARFAQVFQPSHEFLSSSVIPDSQTSNGSKSYIPTTQEASGESNQNQSPATAEKSNTEAEEVGIYHILCLFVD